MSAAPSADDALPLLDAARLAGLKFLPPDKLPGLFAQVLAAAEAVVTADTASIMQAAHRVKGSAGTVGLARLSASAAALELQARQGSVDAAAREHFASVLAATRDVLREQGLTAS